MSGYDPYYGKANTGRSRGFLVLALVFLAVHLAIWGGVLRALHAAGAPPEATGKAFASLIMPVVMYAMVIGGCWLIGVSSRMPAYLALFVTILALLLSRGGRPKTVDAETLRRLPGMAAFTQCQQKMFQDLQHQFMKDRRCSGNEQELARYAELARAARIDDKEAVAVYRTVVVVMNELGGRLDERKKAIDHLRSLCSGGASASIFAVSDLDQLNRRIESAEKLKSVSQGMLEYIEHLPDRLRTVLIGKGAEPARAPELAIKVRDKHFGADFQAVVALGAQYSDLVVQRLALLRDNWGRWTRDPATGDVVAQDPQIQAQSSGLLKKIQALEARFDELAEQSFAGVRRN